MLTAKAHMKDMKKTIDRLRGNANINHISIKGLVSRIIKKLSKLNIKINIQTIQLDNEQKL